MKFELNEKELGEYNEFIKKHKKCKFNSSIGGKITIKFTPTGLGNIIDAVMGAKSDILGMLKDGKLKVSHYGEKKPMTFVIMDARKNKDLPLTVVGFVSWADPKFKRANVIIKTVGKYSNFSSIMRKDSDKEKHIQLY